MGLLDFLGCYKNKLDDQVKSIYSAQYRKLLSLLVDARTKANVTQKELANLLGKPQSFVSKIEHGDRRIDVVEFLKICELLKIDYNLILSQIVE